MPRQLILFVLVALISAFGSAEAQPKKLARIGFLEGASIAESQGIQPFRQALRELGYNDGQNIIL